MKRDLILFMCKKFFSSIFTNMIHFHICTHWVCHIHMCHQSIVIRNYPPPNEPITVIVCEKKKPSADFLSFGRHCQHFFSFLFLFLLKNHGFSTLCL